MVAIGFLSAQISRDGDAERFTLRELRCGGESRSSEAELVASFFGYIERLKPRIVTFNGRAFDFPVLKYRAMLHGVSAPAFHRSEGRFQSYSYRFAEEWHCDVFDVLTDYRASTPVKLDEVSRLLGLPGKLGTDGSQVAGMYDAGRTEDIRNYCELDVLNTYLVYLRHRLHTGYLLDAAHDAAVADVNSYLEAERHVRAHLGEFLDAWRAGDTSNATAHP